MTEEANPAHVMCPVGCQSRSELSLPHLFLHEASLLSVVVFYVYVYVCVCIYVYAYMYIYNVFIHSFVHVCGYMQSSEERL